MIERRHFLKHCAGAATMALVAGCGGGGGGEESAGGVEVIAGPTPAPTPTPTPDATAVLPPIDNPAPGTAIDAAEADIRAAFDHAFSGFTAADQFDEVRIVRSPDELVAFFETIRTTSDQGATFARRTKVTCDWDGTVALASGASTRLRISAPPGVTTGHVDRGGGILVVAAAGRRPAFANQVEVVGLRGIHFEGIDFFRQRIGQENADTAYGVSLLSQSNCPARVIARFSNCRFGARHVDPHLASANWTCAINTAGLPDFVGLSGCSFNGHGTVAKLAVKLLRVDNCDFVAGRRDVFALYSHTVESDYYAVAWISRCTFRASPSSWEDRNNHRDVVQTCTPADLLRGYRLLLTDLVVHHSHGYAGDPGMGGGSQGFFNRGYDGKDFDNQFVVRRCTVLVSSPHGFAYYATRPTRPSFVDQCTFMRSGTVPSGLSGDLNPAQDMAIGITAGVVNAAEPMLFVTRCYGLDLRTDETIATDVTIVPVDPRMRVSVAANTAPETIFVGRDFTRGGRAVNFLTNKFGYVLPNEAGTRAQFATDIWANFEPKGGFAGIGAPDPRAF